MRTKLTKEEFIKACESYNININPNKCIKHMDNILEITKNSNRDIARIVSDIRNIVSKQGKRHAPNDTEQV